MKRHKSHNRTPLKTGIADRKESAGVMKRHSHIEGHHIEFSAWLVQQDDSEDSGEILQDSWNSVVFFSHAAASDL